MWAPPIHPVEVEDWEGRVPWRCSCAWPCPHRTVGFQIGGQRPLVLKGDLLQVGTPFIIHFWKPLHLGNAIMKDLGHLHEIKV